MLNVLLAVLVPFSLVFGLYHLLTWFDVFRINSRVYWRRVALTGAISHFLLATGFLIFEYFDWQSNRVYVLLGMTYSAFLFKHSVFWQLLMIFDTAPGVGVLAAFSLMNRAGINTLLLPIVVLIIYIFGTLQWYFVIGGIGALLQRFWDGLKTGEDGEEWFQ